MAVLDAFVAKLGSCSWPYSLSLQLPVSVWAELALKFRFFRANLLSGRQELVVSSFILPHLLVVPPSLPSKALQ